MPGAIAIDEVHRAGLREPVLVAIRDQQRIRNGIDDAPKGLRSTRREILTVPQRRRLDDMRVIDLERLYDDGRHGLPVQRRAG